MSLRCIYPKKITKVLKEFHFGLSGGYYSKYTIAVKTLQESYYWPSMYIESFQIAKENEKFHRCVGSRRMEAISLQPITTK